MREPFARILSECGTGRAPRNLAPEPRSIGERHSRKSERMPISRAETGRPHNVWAGPPGTPPCQILPNSGNRPPACSDLDLGRPTSTTTKVGSRLLMAERRPPRGAGSASAPPATRSTAAAAPPRSRPGTRRARSRCRFAPPLIHFVRDSLTYSVPLFLKRQCDRTLGWPRSPPRQRWK
jgi:hypothetical protein